MEFDAVGFGIGQLLSTLDKFVHVSWTLITQTQNELEHSLLRLNGLEISCFVVL